MENPRQDYKSACGVVRELSAASTPPRSLTHLINTQERFTKAECTRKQPCVCNIYNSHLHRRRRRVCVLSAIMLRLLWFCTDCTIPRKDIV